MKLEISNSEFLESIKTRLLYISGKRAETGVDFFRYHVCDADIELIIQLKAEAMVWLKVKLQGVELDWKQAKPLLKEALVCNAIYRWLSLAGMAEAPFWLQGAQFAVDVLLENRLHTGSLNRRPVPPI